ncbi:MAG: hypothetical protein U0528_06910 [Anaerolineae bacterium]|nr:hypothetical protein [Anaerolineae bacterium]
MDYGKAAHQMLMLVIVSRAANMGKSAAAEIAESQDEVGVDSTPPAY